MGEFIRDKFPPKNKPGKDEKARREWSDRHESCAACGCQGTETHEIIGGRGGRALEKCNFLRLCRLDHQLATGLDVRGTDGELLPKLTEGHCLYLKRLADPQEYSEERLQQLKGCRLEDPEELPPGFLRNRCE